MKKFLRAESSFNTFRPNILISEMSEKEYALSIKKKCFAAIAFCVIKCKPENLDLKEFCLRIQSVYGKNDDVSNSSITNDGHVFSSEKRPILLNRNFSIKRKINLSAAEYNIAGDEESEIIISQDTRDASVKKKREFTFESSSQKYDINKYVNSHMNFKIIEGIRNIKNALYGLNGFVLTKMNIEEVDRDSILYSECAASIAPNPKILANKRNNIEQIILTLDASIDTFLEILVEKKSGHESYLRIYASDLLGEIVDSLCEKNIHINSLSKVRFASEKVSSRLLEFKCPKVEEIENLKMLHALNKSTKIIELTLADVYDKLEVFLKKMTQSGTAAVGIDDIDCIDNIYIAFMLVEDLLKRLHYMRELKNAYDYTSPSPKSNNDRDFQLLSQNWYLNSGSTTSQKSNIENKFEDLLNKIVICCVDACPLVSFYALDIINNIKK